MGALGRFILGSAVVGAVAAGVYYYLDKNQKDQEGSAEPLGEEEKHAAGKDKVLDAASRAYTTIRHGTEETINNVKKTVGPKGSEVMDVVGDAASKVRDVVADSAVKVKDIVTSKEDDYVTAPKAPAAEEEQADGEAVDIPVEGEAAEQPEEAAAPEAAEPADAPEDLTQDPAAARKADEVEEFFDDETKE